MKEVRVCFEIKNMSIDENGQPAPAGIKATIGNVPDEKFAQMDYMKVFGGVDILQIMRDLGLDEITKGRTAEDVRLITPEEYDRLYGGD